MAQIKKIIAKNFIVPGVQEFKFDNLGGLTDGAFFNLDVLEKIRMVINGGWLKSTDSFEEYYPKFSYPAPDMNLELDSLVFLENNEMNDFNKILQENGFNETKNKAWFLTIKAYYPFIFPVVTLAPANDDGSRNMDKIIGIGSHYEKFIKANSSKNTLLMVSSFYFVSKIREEYFAYKNMTTKKDVKDIHDEYLRLLKSVYRFDEQFIKKVGKIFSNIDDGDVVNYGDQFDFFYRHPEINTWFDSIEILKKSPEIRYDFGKLLFEYLFSNLQIDYAIKSSNEVVEIKKILLESNCLRSLEPKAFDKILKFNLSDEPLEIYETEKQDLIVDKQNRVIHNFDESTVDLIEDLENLAIKNEEIAKNVAKDGKVKPKTINSQMISRPIDLNKKLAEEQAKLLADRKAKILEKQNKKREKTLLRKSKIIVIDSEYLTSDLTKWD